MDHHHFDRGVDRSAVFHQLLWGLALAAVAAGFAYYVASRPMDFRVYHFGARGVFEGTRPVYGLTSGLGWPMHYRYPPLFLLLFAPFAAAPLWAGAAAWVVLKVGVLGRFLAANYAGYANGCLVPVLIAAPYIIEEFRYGNVQFFILALTAPAVLIARTRPLLSAASLALAISIKVWPLFFVPYLAVRREWKTVGWTFAFSVLLTLLPAVYFGFFTNLGLLRQWFAQEFQTQLGQSEIWFPNQSLRGVLMRYLTVIDYSQVPDSNYPAVNAAALDPRVVRGIWAVLAGGIYAAFLVFVHRRRHTEGQLELAVAFCLIALLQPFTQKYALAVLLVPAIAAGQFVRKTMPRTLLYASIVLILIQPLAPGAEAQRLLQVLGLDFFATALLTLALTSCSQNTHDSFIPA